MFLQPCDQEVKFLQLSGIDGKTVCGIALQDPFLKMVKPDGVVSEAFRVPDELLSFRAVREVGTADKIRAQQANPFCRGFLEDEMAVRIGDDMAVFPGGPLAENGKVQRRALCRRP